MKSTFLLLFDCQSVKGNTLGRVLSFSKIQPTLIAISKRHVCVMLMLTFYDY